MPCLAPINRQPTVKQRKILALLKDRASMEGRLPSSRLLAKWLGIRQTAAYGQIVALARRGLLERVTPEIGKPYYKIPTKTKR